MTDQKTEQKPADHKAIREAVEEGPYYTAMVAKPDLRALLADLDAMRGALDHIRKSCQASRSQTRRLRWIEARAYGALTGDHELHRTIDLPKDGGPDTTEKLKRKLAHERYVARVAQGLSVGILTAALKGTSHE